MDDQKLKELFPQFGTNTTTPEKQEFEIPDISELSKQAQEVSRKQNHLHFKCCACMDRWCPCGYYRDDLGNVYPNIDGGARDGEIR